VSRMHVPVQIRWNDLDAYGHVNNAAMLTLLDGVAQSRCSGAAATCVSTA